ncbi:MAG: hypothetical protein IJA26_00605, partial [Clostridia bacterium]|nr:hypothetical protein [Clostridia bacterium]
PPDCFKATCKLQVAFLLSAASVPAVFISFFAKNIPEKPRNSKKQQIVAQRNGLLRDFMRNSGDN